MNLLIIGSRNIKNVDLSLYVPDGVDLIISGGAAGVDTLAEEYADKKRISKLILRPQYALYRRGAPLKRNEIMVDICDKVLVFWDGISKGTKYTIDYAKAISKEIEVIIVEK